jgi:hypothetical protein
MLHIPKFGTVNVSRGTLHLASKALRSSHSDSALTSQASRASALWVEAGRPKKST